MTAMPRRRFGRTGLAMPVLSCGGMRFQHGWKDVPLAEIPDDSQRKVEAVVRRALELGINHIETARGYGTSELQLGRILPLLPRDEMIVQTKIGPRETGAEFLEVFELSLRNLCLDHVDLLGIHGINNAELLEQTLRPGGTLEMALKLKREGRCRWIGFSTHGPTDVIVKAIQTGLFDYVNLHWYWVNPFNAPAIEAAARHDMGVFIISPADKGGKLYEPTEKMKALCAPLTPMQFNNLFCLARAQVHTLSIGAAAPSDFDEHVQGLAHYAGRDEVVPPVLARLEQELIRVLGADWCAHWHEGLLPWEQMPGRINVHEILRLWTYAKAMDLVGWARMRYNLLGQAEHWFPGENAAAAAEHDWSGPLKGHRFADRIPGILQEAHAWFYEAPRKRLSESD